MIWGGTPYFWVDTHLQIKPQCSYRKWPEWQPIELIIRKDATHTGPPQEMKALLRGDWTIMGIP